MGKKCDKCGFLNNPDNANYCGKCGWQLGKDKYVVVNNSDYRRLQDSNNYLRNQNSDLRRKLDATFSSKVRAFFSRDGVQATLFSALFLACFGLIFLFVILPLWILIIPPHEEELSIERRDGKYGIIDTRAMVLFREPLDFDYDKIVPREKCYILIKSGRFGLANNRGRLVVEANFDSIAVINKHTILTYCGDRVGWVNYRGKEILPCEYYGIVWEKGIASVQSGTDPGIFAGNIIQVKKDKNSEWSLYTKKGQQLIQKTYADVVQTGTRDLIKVFDGSGYGLINAKGKQVLPCMYSNISRFSQDRAWCFTGNDTILCINSSGEKVFELNLPSPSFQVWIFHEDVGVVCQENGLLTYYDKDGNVIIPSRYRYVMNAKGQYYNPSFMDGRAIVHDGSGFGYIDKKGYFTPAPDLK